MQTVCLVPQPFGSQRPVFLTPVLGIYDGRLFVGVESTTPQAMDVRNKTSTVQVFCFVFVF